jgi:hypothetical protein
MSVVRLAFSTLSIAVVASSLYAGQSATDKFIQPSSYFDTSEEETTADSGGTSLADGQCGCKVDLGCDDQCCRPLWAVSLGSVILQRGTPHSTPLIREFGGGGATLLDANQLKFNYAAGADILAIRQVSGYDRFDAVDFRYFGVQSSQADASLTPGIGVIWALPSGPPLTGPSFSPIETSYHTKLFSSEFNVRRYTSGGRVTWLAGVRWIQMTEQLNVTGPFVYRLPLITTAGFTTMNNMLGTQVGAHISLWNFGGPLSVVCTSKAGIYGNSSLGSSSYPFIFFGNTSENVTRLAFVGDINVNAIYQWTDHVALRGGWQLLWIEGAATAINQVAATNFLTHNGINTAGNAFYQGAMGSIIFTW